MTTHAAVGRWNEVRGIAEIDWQVVRALMGGTTRMRSMGTVFLPADARERERPQDYTDRLLRTFLLPAYNEAIDSLSSRPFQRDVEVQGADGLPDELQKLEADADRRGTPLGGFFQQVLRSGIDKGIMHVLVDMPMAQSVSEDAASRTAHDDLMDDIRPYFVHVDADNLNSWAWETTPDGRLELASISIYEQTNRSMVTGDGMDAIQPIERIRRWTRTEWSLWERKRSVVSRGRRQLSSSTDLIATAEQTAAQTQGSEDSAYTLVAQGVNPLGKVPLVSKRLCVSGPDPFAARPCLIDLAMKNVEHWQTSSNRSNNLWYAGCPILKGKGVDQATVDDEIRVGAGAVILSTSPDFDLSYVEPQGGGLEQLRLRDGELKDEMRGMAMQPLLQTGGGETATGEAIREVSTQTKAQSWAEAVEWMIYQSYVMAAMWLDPGVDPDEALPEDFDIAVFRDFGLIGRSQQDLTMLAQARANKDISRHTFLQELKTRKVIDNDLDVEEEMTRLDEEKQAGVDMFGGGFGGFGQGVNNADSSDDADDENSGDDDEETTDDGDETNADQLNQ